MNWKRKRTNGFTLVELQLGRLATGLGDGEKRKGDELPAMRIEVTLALEKIYGEPLQGEIVDVEATKIGGGNTKC